MMRLLLLPLALASLVQAAPTNQNQQLTKRDTAIVDRWAQSSVLLSPGDSPLWVIVSGKPYVAGQTLTSNPTDSSTLTLDLSLSISDLTAAPWNITTGGPLSAYSSTLALSSTSALLFGGDATGDYSVPIQTASDSAWTLNVADKGSTADWDRADAGWMGEPMRRQMSYAWSATNGSLARAWIYGGIKSDGSNLGFSELWEAQFDVDGEDKVTPASEWTQFVGAGGPGEIYDGAAVVVPSSTDGALPSVYLLGGVQLVYNIPSLVNLSTIWVFTPGATIAGGSWSTVEVKGAVPSARRGMSAVLLPNGKIWIQGGRDLEGNTAYADGATLDLKKGTWTATASASTGVWGQSAAVVGQNVVLAFGYEVNGPAASSLLVYNPTKDSWASNYTPNYVKTITAISGSTGSSSADDDDTGAGASSVGGLFNPASIFIPATVYTTTDAAGSTSTVSIAATTVAASAVSTITDSAGSTASVAVNLGSSTVTVAATAVSTAVVVKTLGGSTSVVVVGGTSTATLVAGVTVTSVVAQVAQSTTVVAVTGTTTLTNSAGAPTATSTFTTSTTSLVPVSAATATSAPTTVTSGANASAASAFAAKSSTKPKSSTSAAWVAPGTAGIAASSTSAGAQPTSSADAAKAVAAAQQRKTTAIAATCSILGALLVAVGAVIILRRRRSSQYDSNGHYRGGGNGGWGNLGDKSPGSLMAEHNNIEGSFAVGGVVAPSRVRAMQGRREDMLLDEGSEVSFAPSRRSGREQWEQFQAQEDEEGAWVGDLGGLGKRGGLGVWEGYAGGGETAASKMSFLGGVLGGFVGGSPVPEVEQEQLAYAGGSDPYGGLEGEEEEPTRWVAGAQRKEVGELTPINEWDEDEEGGASSVGHHGSEEYATEENAAHAGLLIGQRPLLSSQESHAPSSYRPSSSSASHSTPSREMTPTRTTTPLYGSSFSPSPTRTTYGGALPGRSGSTSSLAQHLLSRKDTSTSSIKSSGGLWAKLRGSTSNNGSAVNGWGNESVVSGTAKEEIRDPTPAPGLGSLGASARWKMKLSRPASEEMDPFLDQNQPEMDEHGRISDMVRQRAAYVDYPTHHSDSSAGGATDISMATTTRLEEQGRYMDVVMVEREGSVLTARSGEEQTTPRLGQGGQGGQWAGTDIASVYSQDSATDESGPSSGSGTTRPSLESARHASIHQAQRIASPRLLGPRPLPSTAGQVGVKGMIKTFEQQRKEYKGWLEEGSSAASSLSVPGQAAGARGRQVAGGVLDAVDAEGRDRGEGQQAKKRVTMTTGVGLARKPVLYVANP